MCSVPKSSASVWDGDHQLAADEVAPVPLPERLADRAAGEQGCAEDARVDDDSGHPATAAMRPACWLSAGGGCGFEGGAQVE